MKNEIKTIIIGIAITILVVFLALFILYKIDQNKNQERVKASSNNNDTLNIESNIPKENNNSSNINENKQETTPTISNNKDENNNSSNEKTNNKVIIYLFHRETCPACVNAIASLKETKNTTYKDIEIKTYELDRNPDNRALLNKVSEKLDAPIGGVPFFVIGSDTITGFNEEQIKKDIENMTKDKNYQDIVNEVIKENSSLYIKMEPIK